MLRISRLFKRVSVCVVCVSLLAASPALADDADSYWEGRKWEAWTELGGYAANRSYARRGELALWAPLMQDHDSLFFADLRGKLFADDQQEGNAAIGYRFMRGDGWNPGIWVGFDRRNTESGTNFDQASFGVEALSADWDLRANGYVPLNDRELVSSSAGEATVEVIGASIFLISGDVTEAYEIAMWGADAEIGWRVPLERFGYDPTWGLSLKDGEHSHAGRHHELRLYAGGYYFDHSDFDGEVAGPRARAEWRIGNIFEDWDGSRLTFEAAWQHDDVREHQIEGGVRLRIPLGGERGASRHALNAQERRMTEGLKRDTDIVSQSQTVVTENAGGQELVEDALTGVDFDTVVTVANGSNLQTGITTADHNALIIALGGSSNFGSVTMQSEQTLLGGAGSIQVRGRTSGTVATYTAPGARPTIAGVSSASPIITADNTHIASVDTDGNNATGAIRTNAAGERVVLSDVMTSDAVAGYFAPVGSSGSTVTIRNSTLLGIDGGVFIADNITIGITDSTLEGGDFYGISMNDDTILTLTNTTFFGSPSQALVYFGAGNSTVTAGSTGNINTNNATVCDRGGSGTFTGTLDFDTGDFTQGNC